MPTMQVDVGQLRVFVEQVQDNAVLGSRGVWRAVWLSYVVQTRTDVVYCTANVGVIMQTGPRPIIGLLI